MGESTAVPEAPKLDADVAVIGGGPVGLAYAGFLHKRRPDTRIVVLEKRARPGFKIGEATLSSPIRCFHSLGLSYPAMRRLFAEKLGLGFWWTGPESDELLNHVDVTGLEETFHVERRALETALQELTRRRGIDLRTGVTVDAASSALAGEDQVLACDTPEGPLQVSARLVCDASGPSAIIPRALGLFRKEADSFDTSAYFGYFTRRPGVEVDLPHWDVAATRHICFPQGWMWFITIASWEETPDDRLAAYVNHLLDHSGTDTELPPRAELAGRFGCSYREVVSVGVVPRDDRDSAAQLPVEDRLWHYVDRYPGLRRVLDAFNLVRDPYGSGQDFFAIQHMAHDCERATGDGWLAVGDAAFFVNPLFSPGMTFGTATAYMGAKNTARALDAGDFSQAALAEYEGYARSVFRILARETEMLYRSWVDPDSFERVLAHKFFSGITDLLPREEYSDTDPFVYDLLNPGWTATVDRLVQLLRAQDAADADPAQTAKRVREVIEPRVAMLRAEPAIRRAHVGSYFNHYTDDLERVEVRDRPPGDFTTWRCGTCRTFVESSLPRCWSCGAPAPAA